MFTTKSAVLASTAFAFFFGVAHADGGDYSLPAAYPTHDTASYKPVTCAENAQSAWFSRQLALTDGDVSPAVATTRCSRDGNFALANDE